MEFYSNAVYLYKIGPRTVEIAETKKDDLHGHPEFLLN